MFSKRRFEIQFEDEGPRTFTFDYAGEYDQRAEIIVENGVPVLYVNKKACALLARIFAKLALASYEAGFHLHLEKDFNADNAEMLRIVLVGN